MIISKSADAFITVISYFLLLVEGARDMEFEKYQFPKDFLFGASTSAYQVEGGFNANGKGQSVYDYYTKENPKKFNNSNGDVACDSYNKSVEDVSLLAHLGVNFYRFSISWSRILPDGYSNNINMIGLRYYNDLINDLISKGIEPMVTMYHRDLPMPMQELGGWTNPYMAYYFEDYARMLYGYFGDRVKYWITLNAECLGYGDDEFPPFNNQNGIANYLCSHVMLLAHAKAYHLYDEEFRLKQKGKIGIVVSGTWFEPGSFAVADIEAAERMRDFEQGVFMNPIYHVNGDYPKGLRERIDNVSRHQEGFVKSRLPSLSREEIEYIQGTYDFLGLNCYTTFLVKNAEESISKEPSLTKDQKASLYQDEKWPTSNIEWLKVYPEGTRKLLKWIKDKYDDPEIFITENGFSDDGKLNDIGRIEYLQKHLKSILESIHEDGVTVKGYAVWSLLDNFEWNYGYSKKFGLYHVDFSDPNRKRTQKRSAEWYRKVIREKRIVDLKELSTKKKAGTA